MLSRIQSISLSNVSRRAALYSQSTSILTATLKHQYFIRKLSTESPAVPRKHANGTAVVFLNMGGPSKISEVYDFLLRLFSDGEIIPLGRFQDIIAKFIAYRRTPTIESHYKEIGGGSPIRKWSEHQNAEACKILDKLSPSTAPHKPFVGFRYAHPLMRDTYQEILDQGITRAVAFSQYPQYSVSTSASSFNELKALQKELDPEGTVEWSTIERWPTHPGLIKAFANHIKDALAKFPEEDRDKVVVVFSAHSIPLDFVNSGDTYPAEVASTVHAVMQELQFSNPYRLAWQSQVGPKAWLGPKTDKTVATLDAREDTKGVVLVPIAFTSDHIETLHELDIELAETLKRPELVKRAESLNGDPVFIEALADIVATHLDPAKNDPDGTKAVKSGMNIKTYKIKVK
jgi:ferrochelatase